ncbi:T-box transcription factor T isoform X4 [Gorilla gorilla gorilla]|uniref:T-box transcription factor T isoform X4 n=1 Tax=Gorilla gorilla gorilla TaxID=9595 RepID=UPI0024458808|nr:T-box transcription factor T isoform X4 [Gorilla gorilla gorilla]
MGGCPALQSVRSPIRRAPQRCRRGSIYGEGTEFRSPETYTSRALGSSSGITSPHPSAPVPSPQVLVRGLLPGLCRDPGAVAGLGPRGPFSRKGGGQERGRWISGSESGLRGRRGGEPDGRMSSPGTESAGKSLQYRVDHLLSAVENELQAGSEKGDPTERELRVGLEESELWLRFKELTNEMIVTKNGRRMFPVLKVNVSGLDPNAMYSFLLDFVAADNHRWKYVNGEWVPGGKPEPQAPSCVYIHPDSPNFGAHWMKAPVSFSKVKLTNKLNGGGQITALKIKYNPFAKAFLDAKERSDHKEMMEEPGDSQQPGYSQWGWLLPGTSTLCPPANPHPQFGGALSLPSTHGCDRYPALRSHRSSPYPSPYAHRNNSPTYSDNSPACLSMLQSHDNWSSLGMPAHPSMLPVSHNASPPTSSSQYPSLWSVSNGAVTPGSQAAAVSNGLGAQFFRGSPAHYTPLTHPVSAPSSSGSPLYEGAAAATDIVDSQYDAAAQGRLIASWTPVSPPSM